VTGLTINFFYFKNCYLLS